MGKDKERRASRHQDDFDDAEESNSGASGRSTFTYSDELVPRFSGQDNMCSTLRWIQDVEDNAEIFRWSPLQQLIVGRRSLVGTAALWLRSEKPFKSWDDLKAGLLREFPDTLDIKTVHEMMAARKKKPTESCIDYLLAMKELGKRGKMPDYVAIKYIIDGIVDVEINKVMLYGATGYSELKEKLKIYETVKAKMGVERRKPISNMAAYSGFSGHKSVRCYNCGENQHMSAQCPHKEKGLKCFRCNDFGHKSRDCTNSENHQNFSNGDRSEVRGTGRNYYRPDRKRMMFTETSERTDKNMADVSGHRRPNESERNVERNESVPNVMMNKVETMNVNNTKPVKLIEFMENGKIITTALIDTGSEVNIITDEVYANIGSPNYDSVQCMSLCGLGQTQVIPLGRVSLSVLIDGNVYNNVVFYVVHKKCIPIDVIIGQEFLRLCVMVMKDGCVCLLAKGDEWMNNISILTCDVPGYIGVSKYKAQLTDLVENYQPIQVKEAPIELKIVLKDDNPIAQRPRRLSLREQQIVEEQVEEWLKNNIIRVSYSEFASPLVLVKKKDGKTRVCVDYRPINKKMVKDEYPLPIIEDLIDKLQGSKVFSVLDLKNSFFHLRVAEESIKFTSFVTHHGQFEFLRAPFGLMNCPKYFMRYVSIIFREFIRRGIVVIFIDDILIPAQTEEQAYDRLKEVLAVASEYGLQFNWHKARLMCREVEYLGHVIEDGEVRPSPDKMDVVVRYPEPKSIKQVHSFIGLTSYFRKYIKDYAVIAKPLSDLLKKDANFIFGDKQKQAFNTLKEMLVGPAVLKIYNPRLSTELHTDASSVAYAAILMQKYEDGLHPVHYMSKRTTEAESRYTSYELEALAIVQGVKKFRHYLYGIKFKIVTDCQAFESTLRKKDLTTRVARWVLLLDQYDYEIEHRTGNRMRHADALSRNPCSVAVVSNFQDQIRRAQSSDDGLRAIIEVLKEKPYDDYILDDNLLYKGLQRCLVIPKSMENDILKMVHSIGHFSKRKMSELICKDYFIHNLDKKIEQFILSCIPCLLASRKAGKQEGWLNCLEKASIPMHTLHCDHIGPLCQTKKMYNYILTVVDGFTKFVWLFPTKSTTTRETIDKLLILQQTFGNPTRYITDRGTAFTSNEFKAYCDEENIQHLTITTGIPRGNGQVERIHRVLISVLTKLCISEPMVWYKHVSRVQRALNSTHQRSIGTTPFELLLGTSMKSKEDLELHELISLETQNCFTQERDDLRKTAKECILKIQEENQRGYNKGRKESTKYKEGDLVAIKRTQFGGCLKLQPKYLGPYEVKQVKRNDRYLVEKVDHNSEGPGRTSSAADFMKRWPGSLGNVD